MSSPMILGGWPWWPWGISVHRGDLVCWVPLGGEEWVAHVADLLRSRDSLSRLVACCEHPDGPSKTGMVQVSGPPGDEGDLTCVTCIAVATRRPRPGGGDRG